ncbi:SGNH/GDSL hydrolase family protein [Massilia antarctica]|uniref:SGNH/GDSL hydrolase family protein n=1 Tax=Massilia antarctica TaxID=2765360 RepID=UPI002270D8D5|nr:GDSL-type esterase/lipase family protein [Massilia sp. H27-R4]MCY0910842.1 GDSL-type esterase/lipase family protein [Massilia sp. H27-R4]
MTTIAPGQQSTVSLDVGQALTLAGAIGAVGVAYRLNQALGGTNSVQSFPVANGTSQQLGPYPNREQFLITCSTGSIAATVGTPVPIPARSGLSIVLFGDSITNQNSQFSPTYGATLAKGYFTQAAIMLEQRFDLVRNSGISGNTTIDMAARIDTDLLALQPQYCFFLGGTNDVGTDVPYATTIANYSDMFARILGAGISLIIGTITPRGFSGMTQARLMNMMALNTWLQNFSARTPGVILVDLYRQMLDHTDLTSTSQGQPVAAWFDGALLHPIAAGAVQMGYAISRQLDGVIQKLPRRLHCNYNGTNGDSTNFIRNGMLMQGSGGTLGLNASGTIAQNWTAAAASGAISGACSMVARSASFNDDFPGNVQRVVITASGVATEIFRLTPTMATPAAGDQVYMEVEFMASASVGTINEISLSFGTIGGTVIAAAANSMPSSTESLAIGTKVYKGVLRTPVMVCQTGIVGLYGSINIRTSAAATAQIDFANARLTKV